ncbi:MAG: hypothetical protein ACE5GA_08355, partial [Candidatus Zixiibacteriota bacterium]
ELRYGSTAQLQAYLEDGEERAEPSESIEDIGITYNGRADRKSPFKAGIMSFVVPGLGQVYNGAHLAKVGAFVGAEVALWTQYWRFNGIGDDRIVEFQTFADSLWSQSEYRRYLLGTFGDTSDAGPNFTHHLPSTNSQQYYEMIGKYDQFSYGWTLAEGDTGMVYDPSNDYANNPFASPKRLDYNAMRASANDAFSSRDRMLAFALVNHLVSAVDAALGAARHNRSLDAADMGLSVSPSVTPGVDWSIIPRINLNYRF